MTGEDNAVRREAAVHGTRWKSLHGGYFTDPAIAQPLVTAIANAATQSPPQVLADLGGGTGFVLEQLLSHSPLAGAVLVNVDLSAPQLDQCRNGRIVGLNRSAAEVTRRDLAVGPGRLMLVMRSLLHYFGHQGQGPFLSHLRAQMMPDEMLVHQTACFASPRDAQCLNLLYKRMRTDKWYPALEELRVQLDQAGWTVLDARPAPPLPLTSADLAERYQLSPADIDAIRRDVLNSFGPVPNLFHASPRGFTAFLHYHILTCVAKGQA